MKQLKNNDGSAMPLILAVVFAVMCIFAVLFQNSTITVEARTVKDAMQKTALNAITQNSEETYPSKREGYSGAYQKVGSWVDATEHPDPRDQLLDMLALEAADGQSLVKRDATGKELYRLEDIVLTVHNTEFASTKQFKATLTLTLRLPVKYATTETKSVTLPLTAKATNQSKFL